MSAQSACCQPATTDATTASATATVTAMTTDDAVARSVCCGTAEQAATAGACCDPGARSQAVAARDTCCG